MTVDEVVAHIKDDFVSWGTGVVIAQLVSAFPAVMAVGIFATLAKWIVGMVLKVIAKEMDFASFFVYKSIKNNMAAATYEDAIRSSVLAAQNGDADEIKKARDSQVAAFASVWTLR